MIEIFHRNQKKEIEKDFCIFDKNRIFDMQNISKQTSKQKTSQTTNSTTCYFYARFLRVNVHDDTLSFTNFFFYFFKSNAFCFFHFIYCFSFDAWIVIFLFVLNVSCDIWLRWFIFFLFLYDIKFMIVWFKKLVFFFFNDLHLIVTVWIKRIFTDDVANTWNVENFRSRIFRTKEINRIDLIEKSQSNSFNRRKWEVNEINNYIFIEKYRL